MPPWSPYEHEQPQAPTSASPRKPASRAHKSSSHPLTPNPTPPPSQPATAPGSPESSHAAQNLPRVSPIRSRVVEGGLADSPLSPYSESGGTGGSRRRRAAGKSRYEDDGDIVMDDRAAPRSANVFSPMRDLDECGQPWEPSTSAGCSSSRTATPSRAEGKRISSHASVLTTVSRKTERRHVRLSLPSIDQLFDESRYDTASPAASPAARTPRNALSPARSASRARSPSSATSRTRSPAGMPRRSSLSKNRSYRRSANKSDSFHSSSKPSTGARWRAASATSIGPATSSPFFRRSSTASSLIVQRRQPVLNPPKGDFDFLSSSSSVPYLQPLVNAFALFVVAAVGAATITAVLAASFSLTFYDDCTRRMGYVQRRIGGSIEGVRVGVERMIGNARGALDIAVRAASSTRVAREDSIGAEQLGAGGFKPEEEPLPSSGSGRAKRSRTTSAQAGGSSTASPTKRRRSFFRSHAAFTPVDTPSPSPSPSPTPPAPCTPEDTMDPGWRTDDDALPFDVPNSTPHRSRAASPQRSRQPSGARSTPTMSGPSALPPRPHLAVLIPSVLLALLSTLVKVLIEAWKRRAAANEAAKPRAGGSPRRARTPQKTPAW
ncbi:hypothetical protein Rhopal_005515-T1 [Rhodotorula paludigena]|uniref:Proteophosphoglycan ppg4 n=1 Tax=Rhodotorula paludigena TaxID=86838 RepID=A0AAV5GRF9_9BASI|nr:hypothetical protein Rhopal_005515-T1 [Rhodotorula paludigena]